MASMIKKSKPTSPGRRFRSWTSRDDLHKGRGLDKISIVKAITNWYK